MVHLPARTLVAASAVAIVLAGCGGGSKSTSRSSTTAAHTTATSATTGSEKPSGVSSVTTGPVRGSLSAADHAPIANKGWPFTVKVTDASGKPLTGTVDIEFAFQGQVVGRDTPFTHPLTGGTWHETLTYPNQAIGEPLMLQAVVHTAQGSITLDWPVTVKK